MCPLDRSMWFCKQTERQKDLHQEIIPVKGNSHEEENTAHTYTCFSRTMNHTKTELKENE